MFLLLLHKYIILYFPTWVKTATFSFPQPACHLIPVIFLIFTILHVLHILHILQIFCSFLQHCSPSVLSPWSPYWATWACTRSSWPTPSLDCRYILKEYGAHIVNCIGLKVWIIEVKFIIVDLVLKGGKRNPRSAFADKICKVAFDFFLKKAKDEIKLDPVGSTVRYEMMKLCTGSV